MRRAREGLLDAQLHRLGFGQAFAAAAAARFAAQGVEIRVRAHSAEAHTEDRIWEPALLVVSGIELG